MEWTIKSMSRRCAASGEVFKEGDEIVSMVCRADSGEILRFDVLSANAASFSLPGVLLGQWKRIISGEKNDGNAERLRLADQEDFFFSLFEGESLREREVLKQILALLLERRRILRAEGVPEGEFQKYVHIRTKKEFFVPAGELRPEDLTSLGNLLEILA